VPCTTGAEGGVMPPGGGGAPIADPGWPGAAVGCALPAGFSRNSPIRCCPHDWQLSGGVGRRTSVPQFPHTKVFSMDSGPFCLQQVICLYSISCSPRPTNESSSA